ncbi:MAG: 3-dehydroquinate synthase [Christensenellales bacterium]|jgi:3-dehydroquinate synthase
MRELKVGLGKNSYEILIGKDALGEIPNAVTGLACGKLALVTDENVFRIHGERMEKLLDETGISRQVIVLKAGEESKSFESLAAIHGALARAQFSRNDLLIAFGGGVVGDICGFAAATYMRGVSYVQIPTTLLAQVDSSIGGKTAINIPEGKNLVGAFHQPVKVLIDTALLETLPEREWGCGWAEIIKYGAILSRELFERLESPEKSAGDIESIIFECCDIKRRVVETDELDRGLRMLLNFGHTFGHAIEALGGFKKFLHGEGVAIGMAMAAKAGEAEGFTEPGAFEKIEKKLKEFRLPVSAPYSNEEIISAMMSDKKNENGALNLILLKRLGEAGVRKMSRQELSSLMERMWENA